MRQFITAGSEKQTVPDESIFRRQLVAALRDGEADYNKDGYITGSELGMFLEEKVTNLSHRSQTPLVGKINDGNLNLGDFVFMSPVKPPPPPQNGLGVQIASIQPEPEGISAVQAEFLAWNAALKANNVAGFNAFLKEYPNSSYAAPARVLMAALQPASSPTPPVAVIPPPAPIPAPAPSSPKPNPTPAPKPPASSPVQTIPVASPTAENHGICPEMVKIPKGSFQMGSPESDTDSLDRERPQHNVDIKSFLMGKTEVTQKQWMAVMGSNPSLFKDCGEDCPVEQVSWKDVQIYTLRGAVFGF